MDPIDAIQAHEMSADYYDRAAEEGGYVLPEALFGLCFEYLLPGQRLLDIGIGTGLSSLPFARAGMLVYGLDGSVEMLKECAKKQFAAEVKLCDIRSAPWPFADRFFDHAIECGTLPFIPELEVVFSEVSRLVNPGGIFAFTIKMPSGELQANGETGNYTTEIIDGVQIYSHRTKYIDGLLTSRGFKQRKLLKFLLSRGPGLQDDVYTLNVAQKVKTLA